MNDHWIFDIDAFQQDVAKAQADGRIRKSDRAAKGLARATRNEPHVQTVCRLSTMMGKDPTKYFKMKLDPPEKYGSTHTNLERA